MPGTEAPRSPRRTIHHADAISWLTGEGTLAGCSLITSMPDFSEFPSLSLLEWKSWFLRSASLVLSACPDEGVVIFYQTDVKKNGTWVDKAYLCQTAAERTGHELLWHKIVCRAPAGKITFGRPGYSHLLCFSKGVKAEISRSTQDVLPLAGRASWTRGMGEEVSLFACRYILESTITRTVVDPFCGHGLVLAIANQLGLDAVGIELSRKRVKKARNLELARWQTSVRPAHPRPTLPVRTSSEN